MSAKPTNEARWAETTGGTPSANITEPASGKKDSGWDDAEKPPAETFNWWMNAVYKWTKWLFDGAVEFVSVALKSVSATDKAPILVAKDQSNSTIRSVIDHLGYRMGRVSEWVEDWRTPGTTEPTGWTWDPAAGSPTRAYSDPTADLRFRFVAIATNAASAIGRLTSDEILYFDDDTTLVWEQIVRTGAAIDSGTSMDAFTGLDRGGDLKGFVFNPDGNVNIQTQADSTTFFTTSVAIAVNTTYRLRVEVIGDNCHAGSNCLVRFFINGTMVREENIVSGGGMIGTYKLRMTLDNNGGSSIYTMNYGPIRMCWNQLAAPDAL